MSNNKKRKRLDALDPIRIDPESGEEVRTRWHLRANTLRDVPTKKLEAADKKLFKKITSGKKNITPKDLKFVSNKTMKNVMQNFEPADFETVSNWKSWEGTYENPYEVTHDQSLWARAFRDFNRSGKKRLEDHFEDWQRHYGKTIMSGGNTPHMYRSIREAQKIGDTLYPTKGMKKGGRVKKKQSGNDIVASLYKGFK